MAGAALKHARRALRLAWVSSIRQPARTGLGILGIAAVGALLFDMLLLSRGLVISFRDMLERANFDVRVFATDSPVAGPPIPDAAKLTSAVSRLPEVEAVVPVAFREAELVPADRPQQTGAPHVDSHGAPVEHPRSLDVIGIDPRAEPLWTLLDGRDPLAEEPGAPVVVNQALAAAHRLTPGSTIAVRGRCGSGAIAPPPASFTVVGVAEFPFDDGEAETLAARRQELEALCGGGASGGIDMLLVRSRAKDGGDAAAAAIRASSPGLHVMTNDELVERFNRVEFSYFRQISFVLATVTLFFGFLLIAVLLTASVNQRLGEIAALRAVGLSRARVVAGVFAESAIMIGIGAALAIPIGFALSIWLDEILRRLPGIPANVHFFVFEPRVLLLYAGLLAASALGAAVYPMRIVARLPIAATLRREVIG
jgi:putative ABC transport system permease protein